MFLVEYVTKKVVKIILSWHYFNFYALAILNKPKS